MNPINLTEGAIELMSNGDAQQTDINPVLQVTDIRLVSSQKNERYRLLLSDGMFTQQGMLATQQNNLVKSNNLQKGSIVQLTQFVCNMVQNRMIIIIISLDVIHEKCDPIGEPKQYQTNTDGNASSIPRPITPVQPMNQPATGSVNPPSYGASSAPRPNVGGSFSSNMNPGRYNSSNASPIYPKSEPSSGVSRPPVNNYVRPPQSSLYNQPPPVFANRGPISKNEAAPRIIPIAALNPYQGRWTIKARVTAKGELRHYNNARGDGKVFSFDLLDSDGGEIRVTCFNAVADQFYNQLEPGRVYMISKGTLKPAQKTFNHLRNDHEIMLDSTSTVKPCFEDDESIPKQQFHFRPISDIEGVENSSILDLIGIVSSISPSSSIMRKNGTETQKRTLQLKDMSGRSVELTLWGNFCNAEGQTLQNMCDSGVFPVLAVKSGRVNDFNGKSVGTLNTSQLFIDPDFPEAQKLKIWFDNGGKSIPAVSISRDSTMVRTDVRKTISQIKDEKLGTSEKPDWITVSATLSFIKVDNFCYMACPVMIGDRQCNKKVTNNGDGKWRCDRCDKLVDECDYRYILQMQIQDHTGLTWVTAFQESGEEIMGVSAKDMYYMKHEEQDDDKFAELVRNVLFTKFTFKLKVKEETFSDEQRVKSTVVKAEKVNCQTETRYLLGLIAKFKEGDFGGISVPPKSENIISTSAPTTGMNYGGINSSASQMGGSYGNNNNNNQYGGGGGGSGMYTSCTSCGGSGHTSGNCPSLMMSGQPSYGGGFGNSRLGGVSDECFKCHQVGHYASACPGNANSSGGGGSDECFKCHQVGHWASNCPGTTNNNANPGRYGMTPKQRVGGF